MMYTRYGCYGVVIVVSADSALVTGISIGIKSDGAKDLVDPFGPPDWPPALEPEVEIERKHCLHKSAHVGYNRVQNHTYPQCDDFPQCQLVSRFKCMLPHNSGEIYTVRESVSISKGVMQ